MTIIKILRVEQTHLYTIGVISVDTITKGFTLELPYRQNQQSISCIPPGNYAIKKYRSSRFNRTCIKVCNVHDRVDISIHPGNKISHTRGCILPGMQLRTGTHGILQTNMSSKCLGEVLSCFRDIATLSIESTF